LNSTIRDDLPDAELRPRVIEITKQLEAAARELEGFGSTLSHDLRAPLRSIEGFSRLLLEAPYTAQLDATGRDYVQRIHRASLRLGQMMEDLLQLVRLARSGVRRERLDLSAIAGEIVERLKAAAPQRQVDVRIEPGIAVEGDANLLRLVMEQLLDNAWKFSAKTEQASIAFGRVVDEGVPALCVRDNGAGFEQKYADKLFRAFQRLHSEREFEGGGMGLAKAQRALLAQGGRIWARAERGAGAAVYFTLPGLTSPGSA